MIQSVLLEEVKQAFPECSSDMCQTESNLICKDKISVFKKLRQAAFLNPSNEELWRELSCIYYSNGFTQNAKGIMSFYKALFGNTKK